MKGIIHAIAGTTGFVCIVTFLGATIASQLFGTPETIASVKTAVFYGMFPLIFALLAAGGSGVKLLGTRTDNLAMKKQKRGPIGFMTSLFVLLPSSYFLSSWADEGTFHTLFYVVQGLEVAASAVVTSMVALNIRDGLTLTGRIAGGSKTTSIEQRDGGPLVAISLPSLTNSEGESLPVKSVTALCRCGASKNKPFCDGTHNEIGFDSSLSEERTPDEVLVYEGEEIAIHYNRLLCSHAAECGKRQKAAFDSSRKPWIVPDNASKDGLLDVVTACPSGALRVAVNGDAPKHLLLDIEGVVIEKNGPYRVSGIPLSDARLADGASPKKYVLCRCGASKNKPYCDGSHADIGWEG